MLVKNLLKSYLAHESGTNERAYVAAAETKRDRILAPEFPPRVTAAYRGGEFLPVSYFSLCAECAPGAEVTEEPR